MMNSARLSFTLARYLARHTGIYIIAAIGILMTIIAVVDIAELFRRVSNKENISSLSVLTMEAIKMPSTLPELIPFGVLFGLLFSFQKLRSSNEVIIARTNGVSLLKLALPSSFFVVGLALVMLIVIDPIASATKKRYLNMEEEMFGGNGRNLTVSTEGIWLRDRNSSLTMIIHGDGINTADVALINPLVYTFDADNTLISRYYPDALSLKAGYWQIEGGEVIRQDGKVQPIEGTQIDSSLSQRDLTHSNKRPETIPIIELWGYINVLEGAGLPSLGHSSYLYYQLATPLLLVGIVLIVARLTLSPAGRATWGHLITVGIGVGLVFYFMK
ncbi:MAG: LptF/LptG family permease, partial [Alphaproteobacteria bacterium]|nr:LptF/LptG family permease [Alphaproteobacteria bacterium]